MEYSEQTIMGANLMLIGCAFVGAFVSNDPGLCVCIMAMFVWLK